jgi:hypothetical protein
MSIRRLALFVLAAAAAVLAACGDDSETTTTKPQREEVAQELPKLPPGWKEHRDRELGFAIGVPPGWERSGRGGKVLFRAPDHLVAVTLAVDRNPQAFEIPLDRFAKQALGALPGFKVPLNPGKPEPFKGTPFKAVETTATGSQATGLKERATLVVLRRDRLVNYTVAILENAEHGGAALDRAVALEMVRTLRGQPVESGATGSQ